MKPKLKPIQDQVVVLMGATSGIGLETAKLMAEKGARVAIIGRSQDGLNEALDQIRSHMVDTWRAQESRTDGGYGRVDFTTGEEASAYGGSASAPVVTLEDQVIGLTADAVDFNQIKAAADQVVQRFGRIDSWVNLTGVSEWALFEDTSPDEFHRVIEVNLLGQSYGAMAALPYLKQQASGALIFISSVAGRAALPYQAAYNASKQGLDGLADTLRMELRYTRIPVSVTTILPSSMNTPLFEKARTKIGFEPHPVPPVYDSRMVAQAILYATQHPVRELIVGDAGHMMSFAHRVAPGLASSILASRSFQSQRTDIEKSAQAPDNLYQHIAGHDRVQGEFQDETMHFNPLTWLSTHPMARRAIYASLVVGAGAFIGWRVVAERNRRRSWRYRLPRMLNQFSRQASQHAMKTSQQAWKQARGRMADMPVVSNLPMMRQPGIFERGADIFLGFWAALTSISLPLLSRRRSMPRRMMDNMMGRITDRIASTMPPVDVLTLAKQRKQASKRFSKMSGKVVDKARDQVKDSSKQAQKTARKTAQTIKEQIPSKREMRAMMKKGQVMMRRQSLVEKLPFGERIETITEKLPINK